MDDVKNICWSDGSKKTDPDAALDVFMKLLHPVIEKHALVKKITGRTVSALWIDENLKRFMDETWMYI